MLTLRIPFLGNAHGLELVTSKRHPRSIFCQTLLAVLLVVAQITVVSHLDLDEHSQDSPCEICLVAATIGSANVANANVTIPLRNTPQPIQFDRVFFTAQRVKATLARGPPLVS
jgi:hypothetical protein